MTLDEGCLYGATSVVGLKGTVVVAGGRSFGIALRKIGVRP